MSALHRLRFTFVLFFTLGLLSVCTLGFAAENTEQVTPDPATTVQTESDIHSLMSGLSDEQVRRLLIQELQKDTTSSSPSVADGDGPGALLDDLLTGLEDVSTSSDGQAKALLSKFPTVIPDLARVYVQLCPYSTTEGALKNLAWVIFFILLGFGIEITIKKLILPKLVKAESLENIIKSNHKVEKLTASLAWELPSILGVFFFFCAAYFCYMFFIWTDSPLLRLFFLAALISITLVRAVSILSSILFSPSSPSLRIVPMECVMASMVHRLVVATFSYAIVGMMFIVVTKKLGAQPTTLILLQLFIATLLLLITAVIIILFRKKVREQILASAAAYGEKPSWGRQQFAAIWHIPALIYLACLWLLLFTSLISPAQHARGAFLLSFFILPIWIIADMALNWIVKYSVATLKIYSDSYDDKEDVGEEELEARAKGKKSYLRILMIARAGLIFGIVVWVASLWNIKIPIFSRLSSAMFDALIIMTLAMLFWRFISNWIERKIKDSIPAEEEGKQESEDEWGSAAARGRSYTLLPMLRRFIGTVLMTMVTLTILSAMGVDIGPLLAGAGVVGLAVGFGAQKLVADMLSGFFYLLDDAFRVGEYIEAGGLMGTVENISLRNVMLRHHRGMLQIVPHSELGSVTNYMRGGMVVKFNLDFPYDADIDKIRKIIKKVGIAMLEDEELGSDFIAPVKSQGVREITNSVMTIRVKFTAKPGTHFVIRREAYRRITEALRAKGIHYAHKKVIVDIPQNPEGTPPTPEQIANVAGAAAQRAVEEEAAQQNQQGEKEGPFD